MPAIKTHRARRKPAPPPAPSYDEEFTASIRANLIVSLVDEGRREERDSDHRTKHTEQLIDELQVYFGALIETGDALFFGEHPEESIELYNFRRALDDARAFFAHRERCSVWAERFPSQRVGS